MWILPLIGYVGVIFGFCFLTLAIASGLYYLSEIVEEHSVISKKLLTRLIYSIILLQLLLCLVDRFPFKLSALAIFSHVIYLQNLRRFPIVKLTDPFFLLSCALVLLNHYLWFQHFQRPSYTAHYAQYRSPQYDDRYGAEQLASFNEIASFFGIFVWLVPFALFVALSAGENVLPTMGSEYATGEGSSFVLPGQEPGGKANKGVGGMAKQAIDGVREWIGEMSGVITGDGGRGGAGRGKRFE